jgi:hypothetical protein
LGKINNDIKDAYAKGKISEQHYKLLDEKINKLSSSQNKIATATAEGSPTKADR